MSTSASFDRYLRILGVEPRDPSLDLLNEIVAAQLIAAPFENLSKLYRYRTKGSTEIPDLDEYLDGIDGWKLGGTCYTNNFHLYTLLDRIGFSISLCGAAMNEPDVHMVSIVEIDDREFIVDVGYAAPFFRPLPRDLGEEHSIDFGRCRYVLHPQDERRRSRLEMFRDGASIHGYLVDPTPRNPAHFDSVIADSYREGQTFMNTVVIERFTPDGGSLRLHNLALTETPAHGLSSTIEIGPAEKLVEVIVERFGVPADIVLAAIDGVDLHGDIYT